MAKDQVDWGMKYDEDGFSIRPQRPLTPRWRASDHQAEIRRKAKERKERLAVAWERAVTQRDPADPLWIEMAAAEAALTVAKEAAGLGNDAAMAADRKVWEIQEEWEEREQESATLAREFAAALIHLADIVDAHNAAWNALWAAEARVKTARAKIVERALAEEEC